MNVPHDGDNESRIKTEARRLVSLLHQQVVRHGEVRSTICYLVELTSSWGVNDYDKTYKPSGASHQEDRADPEMQSPSRRIERGVAESQEAPEEDPQGLELTSENGEPWLDDERWSG